MGEEQIPLRPDYTQDEEKKYQRLRNRYRRQKVLTDDGSLEAEYTDAERNEAELENFRREAIGKKIPISPENLNRIIRIDKRGEDGYEMETIDNNISIEFLVNSAGTPFTLIKKLDKNIKMPRWAEMSAADTSEFLKQFPVKSLFDAFQKAGIMHQTKTGEDAAKKMVSEI